MKRAYADTPEGQVHYRTGGSGEPLLLLHQVGLSSDQYTEMIPVLGKKYRAIAMDLPGYGDSDLPSSEFQIEDYARNAIHFLDAVGIEKTSVVGRLLGVSVAVEMAATYPERVDKIILSNCIYNPDPEEQKARQNFYRDKRMEIKEDGSHLMDLWRSRLSLPYKDIESCQRAIVDYMRSGLGVRAEDGHRALFSYDIGPKLPEIGHPVLLLYGAKDAFLARLETIKSMIPDCRTRVIEDTLSFPFWEKPEEFAQAILEFL